MKNSIAWLALCATTVAAPLAVQAKELTISHGYTPNHVYAVEGFEPWAACLQEKLGAEFAFTIYPSGQIAATKDSVKALGAGLVDVAPIALSYDAAKFPRNGLISLPEFADSAISMATFYRKMLNTPALEGEFLDQQLKPMFILPFPVFQLSTTKPAVTSMEGLKGLLVRSPGGVANLSLSAIGSVPTEMPAADSYIALERGTVQGTFSALESIKPYGIHEVLKSATSNAPFGSIPTIATMSLQKWNSFDAATQGVIAACNVSVETALAEHLDERDKALQKEFAALGIDVYAIDEALLAEMKAVLASVSEQYVARMEARDPEVRALLKSMIEARQASN